MRGLLWCNQSWCRTGFAAACLTLHVVRSPLCALPCSRPAVATLALHFVCHAVGTPSSAVSRMCRWSFLLMRWHEPGDGMPQSDTHVGGGVRGVLACSVQGACCGDALAVCVVACGELGCCKHWASQAADRLTRPCTVWSVHMKQPHMLLLLGALQSDLLLCWLNRLGRECLCWAACAWRMCQSQGIRSQHARVASTPTLMWRHSVSDDACGLRPAPPGKCMCYCGGGMQAGLLQPRSPCLSTGCIGYIPCPCL